MHAQHVFLLVLGVIALVIGFIIFQIYLFLVSVDEFFTGKPVSKYEEQIITVYPLRDLDIKPGSYLILHDLLTGGDDQIVADTALIKATAQAVAYTDDTGDLGETFLQQTFNTTGRANKASVMTLRVGNQAHSFYCRRLHCDTSDFQSNLVGLDQAARPFERVTQTFQTAAAHEAQIAEIRSNNDLLFQEAAPKKESSLRGETARFFVTLPTAIFAADTGGKLEKQSWVQQMEQQLLAEIPADQGIRMQLLTPTVSTSAVIIDLENGDREVLKDNGASHSFQSFHFVTRRIKFTGPKDALEAFQANPALKITHDYNTSDAMDDMFDTYVAAHFEGVCQDCYGLRIQQDFVQTTQISGVITPTETLKWIKILPKETP